LSFTCDVGLDGLCVSAAQHQPVGHIWHATACYQANSVEEKTLEIWYVVYVYVYDMFTILCKCCLDFVLSGAYVQL